MNPLKTQITLDLNEKIPIEYIFAKQGDVNSRYLEITLTDHGLPYEIPENVSVTMRLTKPDKKIVLVDATVDDSGKVIAEFTDPALTVSGIATAEITLTDSESTLSTQVFFIRIEPNAFDEGAVVSSNDFSALNSALMRVEQGGTSTNIFELTAVEYQNLSAINPLAFYIVDDNTEPETISVTGVSLNKSSTSIVTGNTETLTASISPSNATTKTITWASSNTSVATVSSSGVITAVGAGTATITVTTADGGFTASCSVSVSVSSISVTGVSLNKSSTSIQAGNTEQLTASISPSNATNKNVSWSSSNTSVATVNSSGLVTAVAAGTATITVTTADGGFTAICSTTITAYLGLWQGTKTVNGITATISGNHVTLNGTKNVANSSGGGGYLTDNLETLFSVPATWYTFSTGTQLSITILNKSGSSSVTGTNLSNSLCGLRKTDNTILFGATWGNSTGTFTYTCTDSTPVYGLLFYLAVGETLTNYAFDVQFSVNGTRWF